MWWWIFQRSLFDTSDLVGNCLRNWMNSHVIWGVKFSAVDFSLCKNFMKCYNITQTTIAVIHSANNVKYICKTLVFAYVTSRLALPPLWRLQMETFPALLALCVGNSPVTGEFPSQRPMTRSFDVLYDLRPNKSKQPCGWWFGMTQYDVTVIRSTDQS